MEIEIGRERKGSSLIIGWRRIMIIGREVGIGGGIHSCLYII